MTGATGAPGASTPAPKGAGRTLTVGVALPFFVGNVDIDGVRRIVATCDAGGFDAVWVSDHLSARTPMGSDAWFEAVTLLSYLCALAPRLGVGTDVLVAAYRHPLLAAKMLTTLDIVSGGRLVVAVGVGYIEEEFHHLGVPFGERGRYTDECIAVWRSAWSPGPVLQRGRYFDVTGALAEPKPLQRPGPPVWIGGHSRAALERAGSLGDGWHPIGIGLDRYRSCRDELATIAARHGRSLPTLSYSAIFGVADRPPQGSDRPLLSGGPDQILEDLAALAGLGVSNVVLRPGSPAVSVDDAVAQLEILAAEVLPSLAGAAASTDGVLH